MKKNYLNPNKVNNTFEVAFVTLTIVILTYSIYLFKFPLYSSVYISETIIFLFSWLGIFLGMYILFTWYKLTGVFFSLYTIFMMFYFFFNFGQPIMWALGIHIPTEIGEVQFYGKFGVPTNADILNGQVITLICGLLFHFGAVICYKPRTYKVHNESLRNIKDTTLKAMFISSVIIGAVFIPVTLYNAMESLQVALTSGYKELYYSDYAANKSNIFALAEMMFFPSLVGLLLGSRFKKNVMIFVYSTFSIYLLLNLLAGDRGTWVYKIVILIWLSHTCYKKINFKKLLKYIILSLVGLYIVEAIVSVRNIGLGSITFEEFIKSFAFENSPLISTIFEMGGSMNVVTFLIKYGWDVWPYANTYLLGILGMATNEVIYSLDVPFSVVSSWFSQDYLGISWGAGFSMVAESVLNYGPYIAPLVMILIGFIISSLVYLDKNILYSEKPLRYFFAVTSLHVFLPVTRNYFQLLLKNWFYGVILYTVIIVLVQMIIYRKKLN
ncbi:O-antigen polysaccharide polymerase Wzy family protein [Oceanobacillus luteolus]|uniref:O-antigen polysaccharide polymerase Wzy n=1 Tax=Oceanobacillus luteolus TaxID=1274358 RepID=UPI00203C9B80|nr:O-antigen polysaccharide polymerase Wzy [Oceanobacillus luteolus]MCM3741803.1 O-antigen polysaccharide polymerase Wzy family protein [Oceanobacillus luteolus]